MIPLTLLILVALLGGCAQAPAALPTEQALEQADRSESPPLVQLLYSAPLLPESHGPQQQVRMLIWLRHMGLSEPQLIELSSLRALVTDRTTRIVAAEQAVAEQWEVQETALYTTLWEELRNGTALDDPRLTQAVTELGDLQRDGERERELLSIRMEGIRAILGAQGSFLRSLTPEQEALLVDALFLLRHRLDPVGNPGDYRALVGTTYEPGQYAVLTRGTTERAAEPLNIGSLWSDEPMLTGHALHEARREVLLYLVLLEPGLDEAIEAARQLLTAP